MSGDKLVSESGIHLALDGPGQVVDVGAHVGTFSLALMQNPGIRVLAFEPLPWVRGDLGARIHGDPDIPRRRFRVLPYALGARDTIARCRPFISCELEERHAEGCTWSVPAYLDALGYDGYFIHEGRLHPVSALLRPRMQRASESPGSGEYSDPYIFEFYFIHRSQPGRLQDLVDLVPGGYAERADPGGL